MVILKLLGPAAVSTIYNVGLKIQGKPLILNKILFWYGNYIYVMIRASGFLFPILGTSVKNNSVNYNYDQMKN